MVTKRSCVVLLAAPLHIFAACGGSTAPSATTAQDAGAQDSGYVSCAHTAEPAPPSQAPCTLYVGIDLSACGIGDAGAGALAPGVCQANCATNVCSLLYDASTGIGDPVIACGCN